MRQTNRNNNVLKISINVAVVDSVLTLVSTPNRACEYVKLSSHYYHPVSSNQLAVRVTELRKYTVNQSVV